MLRAPAWSRRTLAVGVVASLALGACQGTSPSASPGGAATGAPGQTAAPQPTEAAKTGGTIYVLTQNEEFDDIDPQRAYTGEDLAFFGATIMRSLTAYVYSEDPAVANSLQGDLATDTGTPNEDRSEWSFTLRDGLTWQDGSALTCEDVKYGVSRTFATDVITNGPTYQIQYLDIPRAEDGSSQYKGPYSGEGQALYDQAVTCDGNTITFRLNQPVADFNYTVTLGFSPVPNPVDHPGVDTAEQYTTAPWSNGPYKIEEYVTGNGGNLTLVRNESWDPASDPVRKAYPDRWQVLFGLDAKVIDERLITSEGDDAFAVLYGNVQPENLTTVFADPSTPNPDFQGRAVSDFDPYVQYIWIDITEIPNVKHRQALAAALDRDGMITNAGGAFAGTVADGVVKPNIGTDYAPTGLWDTLLGEAVPATGNPELAKRLIQESAEPMPDLTYDYPQTPVRDQEAAIIVSSLARAGINVQANPIPPGQYYGIIFDDERANEIGWGGWGPDWPNASTIIGPLFTPNGGWNLSRVSDEEWIGRVQAALQEGDRATQATLWQELNKEAAQNVFVIPTIFGLTQVVGGNKVGPSAYQWAPFGSWPYGELYATQ